MHRIQNKAFVTKTLQAPTAQVHLLLLLLPPNAIARVDFTNEGRTEEDQVLKQVPLLCQRCCPHSSAYDRTSRTYTCCLSAQGVPSSWRKKEMLFREEKSTHHNRGKPPFFLFQGLRHLWCIPFFPDLWCIPFSLVFPGKTYTP